MFIQIIMCFFATLGMMYFSYFLFELFFIKNEDEIIIIHTTEETPVIFSFFKYKIYTKNEYLTKEDQINKWKTLQELSKK